MQEMNMKHEIRKEKPIKKACLPFVAAFFVTLAVTATAVTAAVTSRETILDLLKQVSFLHGLSLACHTIICVAVAVAPFGFVHRL